MKIILVQLFSTIALGLWPNVKGFFERHRIFALILFFTILASIFITMFSGCSLLQVKDPQKEAEQIYRKDLKVVIDGIEYNGVGVLPAKSIYKITIFPTGAVDRIVLQSCSRDYVVDRPEKDGWFKNTYTFNYQPLSGLETRASCPIEIAVIEKKSIANGFAYFDFQDEREEVSVAASIQCNGSYSYPNGVGLCMGAANLKQRIIFQEKVLLEGVNTECNSLTTDNGFIWDISLSPSECTYWFVSRERSKNGNRKLFRLTTIGYTAIPYRGF